MSEGAGGFGISGGPEIPGGEAFQKAVNDFNKKAAGAAWKTFARVLGTITEPFFRKGMGERYYTGETTVYGAILWLVGTFIGYFLLPIYPPPAAQICQNHGHDQLAHILQHPLFIYGTAFFMSILQLGLSLQNFRAIAAYRAQGLAYHSRSRGISRWGRGEIFFLILVGSLLTLLNPPVGILFVIAYLANFKLKAEQSATIMSRYLDELDRYVENTYLEDAALDRCPTEITYLHKPLSEKLTPEVRKNIAGSMVGKPVTGIAQRPQRKKNPPTGGQTANTPGVSSAQVQSPIATEKDTQAESFAPVGQKKFFPTSVSSFLSGGTATGFLIGLLLIGFTTWAITYFNPSQSQKTLLETIKNRPSLSPLVEKVEASLKPVATLALSPSGTTSEARFNTPEPAPVVTPPRSSTPKADVQSLRAITAPTSAPLLPSRVAESSESSVSNDANEPEVMTAGAQYMAMKITNQIQSIISEELVHVSEFRDTCNKNQSAVIRNGAAEIARGQKAVFRKWQEDLPKLEGKPPTLLEEKLENVTKNVQKMTQDREKFLSFAQGTNVANRSTKSLIRSRVQ